MALDPLLERTLGRFFPGLLADIAALGVVELSGRRSFRPGKEEGSIKGWNFQIMCKLQDGMRLDLGLRLALRLPGASYVPGPDAADLTLWRWEWYCMHYGKAFTDGCFRCDLDDLSGHHVHMVPNMSKHIPARDVDPDTTDIDPRKFVSMVAEYRQHGRYPLARKKTAT